MDHRFGRLGQIEIGARSGRWSDWPAKAMEAVAYVRKLMDGRVCWATGTESWSSCDGCDTRQCQPQSEVSNVYNARLRTAHTCDVGGRQLPLRGEPPLAPSRQRLASRPQISETVATKNASLRKRLLAPAPHSACCASLLPGSPASRQPGVPSVPPPQPPSLPPPPPLPFLSLFACYRPPNGKRPIGL